MTPPPPRPAAPATGTARGRAHAPDGRPDRETLRTLPVRHLGIADLSACSDLGESRGWGREEHKWRLLLTAGQGYGIEAPDVPGALLGTVVLTPYAATGPGAGHCCVSMVLVAERCARQGLGRRLMEHALAETGDAVPFLSATDAGRPLYEQLGFTAAGSVAMVTGRFRVPDAAPASPVPVRPATAADLPAVRALDAPVFGADRTGLLARLPAFAGRFVVAATAYGTLTGFAASWPNGHNTVIGPVVAEDLPTAQALITDLGLHIPGEIRVDVDARHPALAAWLRAHGVAQEQGVCTLMARSAAGIPGDASRRFAPYSAALG